MQALAPGLVTILSACSIVAESGRNRSILYVAYSRELIEGSAKIAMSSVALADEDLATVPN